MLDSRQFCIPIIKYLLNTYYVPISTRRNMCFIIDAYAGDRRRTDTGTERLSLSLPPSLSLSESKTVHNKMLIWKHNQKMSKKRGRKRSALVDLVKNRGLSRLGEGRETHSGAPGTQTGGMVPAVLASASGSRHSTQHRSGVMAVILQITRRLGSRVGARVDALPCNGTVVCQGSPGQTWTQ